MNTWNPIFKWKNLSRSKNLWFILLLIPVSLNAQYRTFYEHGYKVHHFNDKKVIDPDVGDIWKDPQGRLWIVNVGNLLCYDGYKFELFQPDESTRMNDARDQFERVMIDDTGQIWLSSIQAGVVKYDPGSDTYQRFRIDEEAFTDFNSSHIVSDSRGNTWIAFTRGLLRFGQNASEEGFEKIEIKSLAADLRPLIDSISGQNRALASLLKVPNNTSEAVTFSLEKDQTLTLLAQGELARSPEYGFAMAAYQDYGWITDEKGDTVWKMDPRKSEHAGGMIENRIHAETIKLEAGNYTLHYRTDNQFAYGDWRFGGVEGAFGASWRYSAPSAENWWGIQILDLQEKEQLAVETCIRNYRNKKELSSSYVDVFKDMTGKIWVFGHALQELVNQEDGAFELRTQADWNITTKNEHWSQILSITDKDEDHLWMTVGAVDSLGQSMVKMGIFNKNTRVFSPVKTALPSGHFYSSILQDNGGNLWLGSSDAENLFRLSPPFVMEGEVGEAQLSIFRLAEKNKAIRRIKTLEMDDFNNLWVGTHQQGMFRINLDPMPFSYVDLSEEEVWDGSGLAFIRKDHLGNLWLVSNSMDLIRYHPETGELESFKDEFKGIPFRFMLYMETLPNGNLLFLAKESFIEYDINRDFALERKLPGMDWPSTLSGRFASRTGFYYNDSLLYVPGHLIDIKNWKVHKELSGLLEGSRWLATQSKKEGIWIGRSWGEVVRLNFENNRIDTLERHVSFAYNLDILEDEQGEVWISNNFNLKTLGRKKKPIEYFTSKDGLKKPVYISKIFQHQGEIWHFTPLGTSLVNMETGDISHPGDLAELEIEDAYQSEDDHFVLLDAKGIYFFNSATLLEDTSAPKVLISRLTFEAGDNQSFLSNFESSGPLKFKYQQNDISIDYVGLQLNHPDQTSYRYQLLGLSNQWQEVGDQKTAHFINLPAGNYDFRVQATNGDGYPSEVASLQFSVLQPWWRTGVAKGAYLFLILLSIYGYVYWRLKKLELEKQEEKDFTEALIFAQEEERKRIARDLHDGVGQSLLLIKRQLETTNQVTLDNRNLISTTLEEVRSISQDLHPFQLEKFGLTTTIRSTVDKIEKSTNLFISKEIDNIDGTLNNKEEINLYRTIQEVFNNIVKHSEATAALLHITHTKEHIAIVIKDNGKGFDLGKASFGSKTLGLKTMHERISAIGGKLSFKAVKPKGTQVSIDIPLDHS